MNKEWFKVHTNGANLEILDDVATYDHLTCFRRTNVSKYLLPPPKSAEYDRTHLLQSQAMTASAVEPSFGPIRSRTRTERFGPLGLGTAGTGVAWSRFSSWSSASSAGPCWLPQENTRSLPSTGCGLCGLGQRSGREERNLRQCSRACYGSLWGTLGRLKDPSTTWSFILFIPGMATLAVSDFELRRKRSADEAIELRAERPVQKTGRPRHFVHVRSDPRFGPRMC